MDAPEAPLTRRLQPTRFRLMDLLVLAAAAAVVVQAPLSVVEAAGCRISRTCRAWRCSGCWPAT